MVVLVYLKKRNLLEEVYQGKLSINDARKIYVEVLKSDHQTEISEILGLNDLELNALSQGATMASLIKWRYEGWPNKCSQCGRQLDLQKFGWRVPDSFDTEIVHVECDP